MRGFLSSLIISFISTNGKQGIMNGDGKILAKPIYEEIWSFGSEGLAKVKLGTKYGFVDQTGEARVPAKYVDLGMFADGLVKANSGGKWGYIDVSGKVVIAPQFEAARDFAGGHAKVWKNGVEGSIDKVGTFTAR